jgi:hypothetical protein
LLPQTPDILDMTWVSGEAWFHLSGYINSHNTHMGCCKSSCHSQRGPSIHRMWGSGVLCHPQNWSHFLTHDCQHWCLPEQFQSFSWMNRSWHSIIFNKIGWCGTCLITGPLKKSRVSLGYEYLKRILTAPISTSDSTGLLPVESTEGQGV